MAKPSARADRTGQQAEPESRYVVSMRVIIVSIAAPGTGREWVKSDL